MFLGQLLCQIYSFDLPILYKQPGGMQPRVEHEKERKNKEKKSALNLIHIILSIKFYLHI